MFYLEIAEKVAKLTNTILSDVFESPKSNSMYFTYESEDGRKAFDIRMSGHTAVGVGKTYEYNYECGLISLKEGSISDSKEIYQPNFCVGYDEEWEMNEIMNWEDADEENWCKYMTSEKAVEIVANAIAFDIKGE